ncbi:hypothetical protein, partial [Neisseria sicca]|uniref:hypothetical protein n=1 Tax=Neisseria sicca TaxID=490 RepID=UPI001C99A6E1
GAWERLGKGREIGGLGEGKGGDMVGLGDWRVEVWGEVKEVRGDRHYVLGSVKEGDKDMSEKNGRIW